MSILPKRNVRFRKIPDEPQDIGMLDNEINIALAQNPARYETGQQLAKPGTTPDPDALRWNNLVLSKGNINHVDPVMFYGTYQLEKEAIGMTATSLLNHPNPEDCHGYFLCGGTESLLQAGWVYRNKYFYHKLMDKTNKNRLDFRKQGWRVYRLEPHLRNVKILTPLDTHMAVEKAADILGIGRHNVELIELGKDFKPNLDSLREVVQRVLNNGDEILMCYFTVGDSQKGLVTDIAAVNAALLDAINGKQDWIPPIIVDAAGQYIFASVMANSPKYEKKMPVWDFRIENVKAIVGDPHKNQIPYPAGLCMFREKSDLLFADTDAPYLHNAQFKLVQSDHLSHNTVPTSRTGSTAVATWGYLLKHGLKGLREKKEKIWKLVKLARDLVVEAGFELLCEPETNIVTFSVSAQNPGLNKIIYDKINSSPDDFYFIGESSTAAIRTLSEMQEYSTAKFKGRNLDKYSRLILWIMDCSTEENIREIIAKIKALSK